MSKFATAKSASPTAIHLGMIEIARVVRDTIPIQSGPGHATIGNLVDEMLVESFRVGEEMQTVTVHLAEESRAALAAMYAPKPDNFD